MDAADTAYTSWGEQPKHVDMRALRTYNAALRKLSLVGEVLTYVLATLFVSMIFWTLFTGNFENAIFTDGTSLTCILDGNSGEIVNAN
jgi:hypothetical protein